MTHDIKDTIVKPTMTTIKTQTMIRTQGEGNQEAQVGVAAQGGARIKRATATATAGSTGEALEAVLESMSKTHNNRITNKI